MGGHIAWGEIVFVGAPVLANMQRREAETA
jgi:hypothetical protein